MAEAVGAVEAAAAGVQEPGELDYFHQLQEDDIDDIDVEDAHLFVAFPPITLTIRMDIDTPMIIMIMIPTPPI